MVLYSCVAEHFGGAVSLSALFRHIWTVDEQNGDDFIRDKVLDFLRDKVRKKW